MEKTVPATSAPISEAKYNKLAVEYSKLRAQAIVLKKALLEEQEERSQLKEQLRQRESALRRSEQEVDSLGFRNKQLEHRVTVLQEEIAVGEGRASKREKDHKRTGGGRHGATPPAPISSALGNGNDELAQDALIFEELQKKIMENAQLTTLVDDKERDLQLHAERIGSLEEAISKQTHEHSELDRRWRRELEALQVRNSELETKLVEAASIFGSEDALSVSGSDHTPLHNHLSAGVTSMGPLEALSGRSGDHDRIVQLEKEAARWRTQYEIVKLHESLANSAQAGDDDFGCSTAAAGLMVKASCAESSKSKRDSMPPPTPPTREQLLFNLSSSKYEELLLTKCRAESRVVSYTTEVEHLQTCLEQATKELKLKDEQIQSINRAIQMLEEDLATTRINYEEQISVMTEQVISLSEQLAACK